jgi:hypothetical protein
LPYHAISKSSLAEGVGLNDGAEFGGSICELGFLN